MLRLIQDRAGALAAVLIAACPSFAVSQVAQPQQSSEDDNSSHALQEITVTARKRDESLQDVPISITAVSGETLRALGVQRMENFAPSIPNFHYSLAPSANDVIFIRGIGTGVNFGFETAVGLVVDGFYYGKTKIGRAAFLDLERVEVLKGPQGAILGKNNSAGAINLTSAKPTNQFESMVSATGNFEGDDGYTVEGFVSGPLSKSLKGRFAFRHDAYDGYIKNLVFGQPEQTTDDWTGRATLDWDPKENVNVRLSYQRVDFERRGHGRELFFCGPGKTAELSAPGFPSDDCKLNFVKSTDGTVDGASRRDRFPQNLDMTHLAINWNVLGHTVTSLTGYMRYDTLDDFDGDNTPTFSSRVSNPENYNQLLQELRLRGSRGPIDYTLGLFYLDTQQDAEFHFILPSVDLAVAGRQNGKTKAAFGEVTFRVSDAFDVTVGGRYTDETKDLNQNFHTAIPWTTIETGRVYEITPHRKETNFSPTIDLRWIFSPDVMVYGSVRRGFRGGGFDRFLFAPSQAEAEASVEFGEETVTAYEVGTKLQLLDDTMRLNLAVFKSDYKDLQVASFVTATQFRVDNAATATTKGVEVGLDLQPADRFLINLNLGYLDAEFNSFASAQCYIGQTLAEGCRPGTLGQNNSGRTLPYAPHLQGSLGLTYEWSVGSNLRLKAFGQVTHSAASWVGTDYHPAKRQSSYDLLNARMSLTNTPGTWELALLGRNLTDETVITFTSNSSPDGIDGFLREPRVIGVQGTLRF